MLTFKKDAATLCLPFCPSVNLYCFAVCLDVCRCACVYLRVRHIDILYCDPLTPDNSNQRDKWDAKGGGMSLRLAVMMRVCVCVYEWRLKRAETGSSTC